MDYPTHLQYATEIIYVLKGILYVYINSANFHIDPNFFEKYYADIERLCLFIPNHINRGFKGSNRLYIKWTSGKFKLEIK